MELLSVTRNSTLFPYNMQLLWWK